ncbi:MAG: SMC family ATPase [Chloroflexi bacterium]|nr:SMC family ATPase [Chloroflexota bacterium]
MIPLKLSLKNFLSYRDSAPVLDLEGVHVACLCGDNGHGKSALLDAITWALWGTARARVQEELVYQGESEMRVDLEFQAGDGRYRVARRFARASRGRQGTTFLELFHSSEDGFQPITGNSVRETEAKIRSLLRMDYDTFVNSAFILQGRADMFTTSTPSKRKELLGEVLNLSWYERLAERARAQARGEDASIRLLGAEISSIDSELSRKEEYQARLDTIAGELTALDTDVKGREARLDGLQGEIQRLQGLQQELGGLEREEKRVLEETTGRESRVGQQRKRIGELHADAERLPKMEADLAKVRISLEQMAVPSPELEQQRRHVHDLQSQALHLKEVNVALKAEMDDLRVKVDLLHEASGRPDGIGASCPLCGEDLGEEGCERLAASYEAQGRQKAGSHRENEASVRQMESERAGLEMEVAKREVESLNARQKEENRRDTLFKAVERAGAAIDMVAQLTVGLESEEALLHANHQRLQEVQQAMPLLKEVLVSLSGVLDAQNEEKSQLAALRTHQQKLIEDRGVIQAHLERCRELELRRVEKVEAHGVASHQKGVFDQLSGAFGKGGIQALLIEQALPELEDQANDILGRVTDHRMNLKLETQRERRGGGDPRETLDIKISDELGTRSYETYSGGEAFRINFALRIALSKLLAHRSGAPLPTLFIDEGFGTQDASGLERLVQVINAIQDDFQRIIVITHIEELKEAFPVRIEVTKTNEGSTFTMT